MISFTTVLLLISLPFASASCGRRTSHVRDLSLPKFGYEPATIGPLNWHNLDPSYFLCANGTRQAPTNVISSNTTIISGSDLQLNIPISDAEFENLGTTVEVVMNGTLAIKNVTYTLKQFHFHIPSEHYLDGEVYAQEMHFVFQTPSNDTAVLAFLLALEPSSSTPPIDRLAASVGSIANPGDVTHLSKLDFTSFIKTNVTPFNTFFTLIESLTTPPCTEGVRWYIATKPVPIAVSDWAMFKSVIKFNARYQQNVLGQKNILELAGVNLPPSL